MRGEAFLEAITAEPEEDAHRLVYADWLDDQGGDDNAARAEFIRVQCALARLPRLAPRRQDLLAREQAILRGYEAAWAAPLRGIVSSWYFRRGFIEGVTITAEALMCRGEELYRLAPVRHIRLRNTSALAPLVQGEPNGARKLAALLAPLRGLDFSHAFLGDDEGLVLLDLPSLPRLTHLNLARSQLSVLGLRRLGESGVLESLTSLECGGGTSGFNGVQALLESPHLVALEELKLTRTRLPDSAVATLMLWQPVLARLRALHLAHGTLTQSGLEVLVRAPAVSNLKALDVSFNDLGVEGVRSLTSSPELGELEELNLSHTYLGDTGVRVMAASPLAGQLQALDLSLNRIGDVGAAALANYAHPSRLAILDLIYNRFDPDAMNALRQRFGEHVCLFHR
jgi:uncharacterized protein (TIGR02996 family)